MDRPTAPAMPHRHGGQRRSSGSSHCRRLRSLVAATSAPAMGAQRTPVGTVTGAMLPLPLDTAGGGVDASVLAGIRQRKQSAVASEDFRLAAELSDLLRVLDRPGGHNLELSSDDFAFDTLEEVRASGCVLPLDVY